MRNSDGGFTPSASHATNSSRECSGVISIWSRAMQNPDERRFEGMRAVSGMSADQPVRGGLRQQYYHHHRAGASSLAAGAGTSSHEQPSRSSRPQSRIASASDNFEPTCFSIAVE